MSDLNSTATWMDASSREEHNTVVEETYCRKHFNCEFIWKIPNFELYVDTMLESQRFSHEDSCYKWYLELEIAKRLDAAGILRLRSCKNANEVFGKASGIVKIAIINSENENSHVYTEKFSTDKRIIFEKTLMKKAVLSKEDYESLLPNGELKIRCHISFVLLNDVNSDPVEDFSKYFNQSTLSDLIINVHGEKFFAHKFVLSASSLVFRAMFAHDTMENQENRIDIKDIDVEIFHELLRYIYERNVKNLSANAFQLLIAADKYDIKKLKQLCEWEIENSISNKTAVEILLFSEQYNFRNLKDKCIEFILLVSCLRELEVFMESERWNELASNSNLMVELLRAQNKKHKELLNRDQSWYA